MQQRICIYSTCYQQNNYIDDCPAHCNVEQFPNDRCHQRCCHTEGCRRSRKQGKYRQQINDSSCPAIRMFSKDRAAGFGVFLAVSFSHMEHETKCHRQYQIKSPRDKAPVKQRIDTSPLLDASHFLQMRIGCI